MTTTYAPLQLDILKAALRKLGGYPINGTPTNDQLATAEMALNLMLKTWRISNFLWLKQFVTIFPVPGQSKYKLPGANGAKDFVETKLSTAVTVGFPVATITVADASGFSDGDTIGIVLDSGVFHWDTVSGAPVGSDITLSVGVPSSAAAEVAVVGYSVGLYRPSRVFAGNRIGSTGNESPLEEMSRSGYFGQSNKSNASIPAGYYYDPQAGAGELHLWPPPSNLSYRFIFDMDVQLEDLLAADDPTGFPQEWNDLIIYGLAIKLAPEYGLPMDERRSLANEFQALSAAVGSYDTEFTSMEFGAE